MYIEFRESVMTSFTLLKNQFQLENTADFVQVSNRTGSIIQGDVFEQDEESWEVTNYANLKPERSENVNK